MQEKFSALTDPEWEVIKEIIDNQRKIKHEKRVIINALLWLLTTGSQWRNMESKYPPWQTIYYYFRQWKKRGIIEELLAFLAGRERKKAGRQALPSVLAIDSQSVKIIQFTSQDKGIDGNKKVNGRKRHLAVDCLGIPWAVHITAANISDTTAGYELAAKLKGKSARLHTLKADNGYTETFVEEVKKQYGWSVEIVQKPESVKGFVPAGGRWVVERSYGWLNFKRRLSRDFEKSTESSEAMLQLAFIDTLLKRKTE
ncbi:IS5 family transposase [Rhodocytophaga rosea]|uniref:IS5 family transposase n=1 Tax=Rhodocytophaga rosea TaxID=2704465 RepID=A0A6C0GB86_9BACT|nr:IS5 family transposase [Rhodocytophaga rosea]QHT65205.1 IS5 family transposase [Rhodocytophaga rosea]